MPFLPRSAGLRGLALPLFVMVLVAMILNGWSFGLIDYDYYWHVATGRWVWENGRLPQTDPFSWTFQGQDWIAHEWLFQLIIYGLFRVAGDAGAIVFAILCVASAWAIAVATGDRLGRRPLVLILLALLFGGGLVGFATPRPHLLSFLLFAAYLAVIFRARYRGRLRELLWLAPLMVVWVNVHGGYAMHVDPDHHQWRQPEQAARPAPVTRPEDHGEVGCKE